MAAALAPLAACSRHSPGGGSGAGQVMEGFVLSLTDQGKKEWTLRSVRASLDVATNDVDLETPRMELYSTSGVNGKSTGPAQVASKHGVYRQSSGDLHLEGDVTVHSQERGEPTTLETQALDFASSKGQFQTDKPVLITRGRSRMKGRGLRANRDLTEIHVLHQEAVLE